MANHAWNKSIARLNMLIAQYELNVASALYEIHKLKKMVLAKHPSTLVYTFFGLVFIPSILAFYRLL